MLVTATDLRQQTACAAMGPSHLGACGQQAHQSGLPIVLGACTVNRHATSIWVKQLHVQTLQMSAHVPELTYDTPPAPSSWPYCCKHNAHGKSRIIESL
jgi:hypothetical protein